jgi:hypothetical protein
LTNQTALTIKEAAMSINLVFAVDDKQESAGRHINPDGSLGGFISRFAKIGSGVFVHPLAIVGPFARIPDGANVPELSHIGILPE